MDKDRKWNWRTNVCLWSHVNSTHDREQHDYYATSPDAINKLLQFETLNHNVRECACWEWHLSKRIEELWYNVMSTDLIERWYWMWWVDFLKCDEQFNWDIVTNPPFKYAKEFIEKWLSLVNDWAKVCMFLRIQFLESKSRYNMFKNTPPKKVLVFSSRIWCAMNWQFWIHSQSAVPYARYVREKWYKWNTILDWIK